MTSPEGIQRYLSDLESRLLIDGRTGEGSSAPILDAAKDGLRFFAEFGPLHARREGGNFDYERRIRAPFDAQREIAFGSIHADVDELRELRETMTETSLDYRDAAAPLFSSWQGKAADAARQRFDDMLSSAGAGWSGIARLADTIESAVSTVERAIVDKARAVSSLATDEIEGFDADTVEFLLDCAGRAHRLTDKDLARLARLPGLGVDPAAYRADPARAGVGANITAWLDSVFVPAFDSRLETFDNACADAERAVQTSWDTLRAALQEIKDQSTKPPADDKRTTAESGKDKQKKATRDTGNTGDQPDRRPAVGAPEESTGAAVPAPTRPSGSPDAPGPGDGILGVPPESESAPGPGDAMLGAAPGSAEPVGSAEPAGSAAEAGPGNDSTGTLQDGQESGADATDMSAMRTPTPPVSGPVAGPAAGTAGAGNGFAGGYLPVGYFGGGGAQAQGGDKEHKRSVPLSGPKLPDSLEPAWVPTLGELDPPPESDEPASPEASKPVAEEQKQDEVWEVTEDGDLRSVQQPEKRPRNNSDSRGENS